MAAIAIAESHPPGRTDVANTDALNPNDNNGSQSSFGAWQISNGTHMPPANNWSDLNEHATLAVQKYQSQGLGAWGTYTSGAYQQYVKGGTGNIQLDSAGSVIGGVEHTFAAPLELGVHLIGDLTSGAFWSRIGKGALGVGLALVGGYMVMKKEGFSPVQETVTAGTRMTKKAA
jgi:hypothetical protein